ncbi:MAG: autotransporter domain-containing protein [Pseudomonadota bacterium]
MTGTFTDVTTNFAFLTPSVVYDGGDGNDVILTLLRTVVPNSGGGSSFVSFCSVANTRNQCNVAEALDKFPTDNPLFLAVLTQTAAGARQAFDALSGEVHATVAGTLVDDSRYAREAVMGRMMQASHIKGALSNGGPQSTDRAVRYDSQAMRLGGADTYDGKSLVELPQSSPLAFWTQGYGAWGTFDGDGNAATADRNLGGFISGMDADVWNGWRVGIATGASFSDVSVDQRYSGANTQTYHLGGYVNGDVGGFALRGGGLWAWSDIETSRAVVFPNFFERQKADYDADTGQLFGEVAYPTQMGGIDLEPFAGLAFVSVESGSFRERGGPEASLRTGGFDQDVGYTRVGLRAATTLMWGAMAVTPRIEAAWLHAFDDVTPGASLAFATTGIGFAIDGVPLAEDSAILDAGLDFAITERLTAGVSYTGQWAGNVSDNGVKGRFTFLFN